MRRVGLTLQAAAASLLLLLFLTISGAAQAERQTIG
jgi:hypothetical protein